MSRIGKLPISVPEKVQVEVGEREIRVRGPKGELSVPYPSEFVNVQVADGEVRVERRDDGRKARGFHGLVRRLVANLVQGVSEGFTRVLEIQGVGYRADARGDALHLSLGYSHPVVFQLPEGVSAKVDKQTVITLEGADNQVLGQTAAMIRALRPPEPYKGKGIKYAEEQIRRKAGKAAGAAGS